MNFAFGCARKLYDDSIHPRLLFGPSDIPVLRKKSRAGDGKRIMDALRRKSKPDIARLLSDNGVSKAVEDARARIDGSIVWNLFDIAMVGVLDGDEDAVEAARRGLRAITIAHAEPRPENSYTMMYGCHPIAYDVLYDRLDDSERKMYADWVINASLRPSLAASRASFLKVCGANTPICYTIPAITGMLAIIGDPHTPDLTPERDEILRMLDAALQGFVGPDGYPHEDVGYGTAVAGGLSHVVEAVRRAGLYDAYAECVRYTRVGEATLQFVQPWGEYLTNNGDHSDCFLCRELPLARMARENRSPELLWLMGTLNYPTPKPKEPRPDNEAFVEVPLGRKGVHLPSTAISLMVMDELKLAKHPRDTGTPTRFLAEDRGLVSLRDSWDADASYVNFDGCHRQAHAQGHAHASAGHFSFTALGEYFAIWPSRYNIEQNCHNVTLVDGKSGRSTNGQWLYARESGVLSAYTPGAFVDFASVDSTAQHNCFWARRAAGFVRRCVEGESSRSSRDADVTSYLWTVDDLNKADNWAEFWWQLHTSPENTIATDGKSATITGWRHGNHLDVRFALLNPNSFPKPHTLTLEQDVASPSSYEYVKDTGETAVKRLARPAEMVHGPVFKRPRLLAKVAGYNGRFMSLMLPRRKGATPAKVEALPTVWNALAMRVTFARVEDTVIWAYEHGILEAGDVRGRGRWCVVRRSRKTGEVLRYEIGGGDSLRVDGKNLRVPGRE